MNANSGYFDTSAILKLVIEEDGSLAMREAMATCPQRTTSAIARTEMARSLRKAEVAEAEFLSRRVLMAFDVVGLDDVLLENAGSLDALDLRSLDAIHLASVLSLESSCEVAFTYDKRLKRALTHSGVPVGSPGVALA